MIVLYWESEGLLFVFKISYKNMSSITTSNPGFNETYIYANMYQKYNPSKEMSIFSLVMMTILSFAGVFGNLITIIAVLRE